MLDGAIEFAVVVVVVVGIVGIFFVGFAVGEDDVTMIIALVVVVVVVVGSWLRRFCCEFVLCILRENVWRRRFVGQVQ